MLTPAMLDGIPLLQSVFAFTDPEEPTVLDVPESREVENRGLELLRKLVLFSGDKKNFCIPSDHMEMLGLVRLADYVGMDDFLEVVAKWLEVSVMAISNHNPVRRVHQLIRGRYRASRHKQSRPYGYCGVCKSWIYAANEAPCRPQEPTIARTPCCNQKVHSHCIGKLDSQCNDCFTMLRVLPCVVCRQPIAYGEDFAREYAESLPHRSPCCEADCHPECKPVGRVTCRLCRCPLKDWKFDKEVIMPDDITKGRYQR